MTYNARCVNHLKPPPETARRPAPLLPDLARAPEDRRNVIVDLTPAGRDLIEKTFPQHAQDIAEAMAGLDAAELATLETLLRKLGQAAARQ